MRLLKTTKSEADTFELELFSDNQVQNLRYAILSHTWGEDEITLQNINDPSQRHGASYKKIDRCCSVAHKMGYEYVWIDTCCIDQTSSAELSEAINSMFLWYQEADVCYAYLSDVPHIPFEECRWFTRGWTLQELIAPRQVIFFDQDWVMLGDKATLRRVISQCTRIPESILLGEADLETFSIAQRMSWAAERQTSRFEDRAYSLMGLFGVHMPPIYGEREAAFIRLQEEILRISEDHSIFAWKSPDTRGGLLATSPDAFLDSHDIVPCETLDTLDSPLTMSGRGIHLDLCFIGLEHVGLGLAVLQCKRIDEDTAVAIFVHDPILTLERFKRVYCGYFENINLKTYHASQCRMTRMCIQTHSMTRYFQTATNLKEYNNPIMINIYPTPEPAENIDWSSPRIENQLWRLLTQTNVEAVLNYSADGRTALCWAAENGFESHVRMLLKRGAPTEVMDKRIVDTPLALASQNGHTTIVKLLLEKGANAAATGSSRKPPLAHAISAGHEDVVRALIDNGAPINATSWNDQTPLVQAIALRNIFIMSMLLDKGANVNEPLQSGWTPLMHAIFALSRSTDSATESAIIVEMLISRGADINAKADDHTPLSLATKTGSEYIIGLLLERGAIAAETGRQLPLAAKPHRGIRKLFKSES
ncbi:ankyrin repeat-containing domain protein [Aspergillus bertholletiae]|uniref:Ankyrin repeat-containing domain protein n=1 Tax=Aspergillus bertholletiae TaxID=1226010 RepID=A0A5N7BDG2_9EURO|nr:ankyrin repeat-containing domain protein [Aspergillus bertholletiae]